MNIKNLSANKLYTLENLCSEIHLGCIKRIVVMTGAGISTSSGIPDFRSSKTGIYSNLTSFNLPYPEAVFELNYFKRNPKAFFTLAKDIMPNCQRFKPNKVHYFLRLLQEKQLLKR